jgi:hypothetical protein
MGLTLPHMTTALLAALGINHRNHIGIPAAMPQFGQIETNPQVSNPEMVRDHFTKGSVRLGDAT